MKGWVNISFFAGYVLTEILNEDVDAFVEHLRCKAIADNTLAIPYPYTKEDAEWWVNRKLEETALNGRPVTFAIRNPDRKLIGTVGFDGMAVGKSFKAELGYCLAEAYWGQGVMTSAVQAACKHAFDELSLEKITAHVFAHNSGSKRVLEKSGFVQEGFLRKHEKKQGQLIDCFLFALLKP